MLPKPPVRSRPSLLLLYQGINIHSNCVQLRSLSWWTKCYKLWLIFCTYPKVQKTNPIGLLTRRIQSYKMPWKNVISTIRKSTLHNFGETEQKILMTHPALHTFLSNQMLPWMRMPLPQYHLKPARLFTKIRDEAFNICH